jgi:hypothetical protein
MAETSKSSTLSAFTAENRSLVDRARELHGGQVWIGAGSVFNRPSDTTWDGVERRGLRLLTAEDIANVLHLTPAEVAVLASRKAIPGAFREEGAAWWFDASEFRSWVTDLHETFNYIPR